MKGLTIESFPDLSTIDERANAHTPAADKENTVLITALCPAMVPAAGAPLKLGQNNQRNRVPECKS